MNGWHRMSPEFELAHMQEARSRGLWSLNVRIFQKTIGDGHLTVLRSQDSSDDPGLLWHLSVSHRLNQNPPVAGRAVTERERREVLRLFAPVWPMEIWKLPETPEHVVHYWEVR